jgi:ssRNA-specific RNase YbeY (16S rRNA maturation enzyme)
MEEPRRLVIVGDSEFAEIAYEYFTYDSPYEVVAFSVEKEYLLARSYSQLL